MHHNKDGTISMEYGDYKRLSVMTGLNRHTVSRVLRGLSNCTTSVITELALALNVDTVVLFNHIERNKAKRQDIGKMVGLG